MRSYALIFIIYPVFLLAQTLPLVSCYFKDMALQAATGRLLFLSTLGSFLGAVLTSLVLMNWVGVSWTCCFILGVLVAMTFAVCEKRDIEQYISLGP